MRVWAQVFKFGFGFKFGYKLKFKCGFKLKFGFVLKLKFGFGLTCRSTCVKESTCPFGVYGFRVLGSQVFKFGLR